MRRSHQNASILILTCLIQRSDESRMSSLISAIRCFRFSPLETCMDTRPWMVFPQCHRFNLPPIDLTKGIEGGAAPMASSL
jgi:hypothetical protein